jgi:hypothetical protein
MLAMAARQRSLRDQVRRGPSGRRPAKRPAVEISRQTDSGHPVVRRKGGCACGGGCPRCGTSTPGGLKVGPADDRFEREADQVAGRIMAMPGTPARRQVGELDPRERIRAKALPGTIATGAGGLEAAMGRSGRGRPLPAAERAFFEPRFGRDLGAVRLHDDAASASAAENISARAFTLGSDIFLGAKAQGSRGAEGRHLLAHELTHVVQQQAMAPPNLVQREPTYPDDSCAEVQGSIGAAWPTSQRWVQVARSRLSDPSAVSSALQRHFKIDPEDPAQAADLAVVRNNFQRQEELYDTAIDNRCTPPGADCASSSRDGGTFAARVFRGHPERGIEHCLDSARTGFLTRRSMIETLVHEFAHLADPDCRDYAYRHTDAITSYQDMTREQAIHNADSYSEFAHQMFLGPSVTPLVLGLSTGALLSSGRPRWMVSASLGFRSQTGIEVFDLAGGAHFFLGLDPTSEANPVREFGTALDFGVISRSADTRMFADVRLGGFMMTDMAGEEPQRAGLTASTVIGWADSGFSVGINMRMLFDFLSNNHAVIIGGEFHFGP